MENSRFSNNKMQLMLNLYFLHMVDTLNIQFDICEPQPRAMLVKSILGLEDLLFLKSTEYRKRRDLLSHEVSVADSFQLKLARTMGGRKKFYPDLAEETGLSLELFNSLFDSKIEPFLTVLIEDGSYEVDFLNHLTKVFFDSYVGL